MTGWLAFITGVCVLPALWLAVGLLDILGYALAETRFALTVAWLRNRITREWRWWRFLWPTVRTFGLHLRRGATEFRGTTTSLTHRIGDTYYCYRRGRFGAVAEVTSWPASGAT